MARTPLLFRTRHQHEVSAQCVRNSDERLLIRHWRPTFNTADVTLVDPFLAIAVPGIETVEDFAGRYAALGETLRSLENDLTARQATRERQVIDLAALRASIDVPSEDELIDARTAREGLWKRIRRLVSGGDSSVPMADRPGDAAPEGVEPTAGPSELAETYEIAVATADVLAVPHTGHSAG